jgi:drug/metabolite transporter (DMT)-like permease
MDARSSPIAANLAALAVVLMWGLSFVASKAVLNTGFPPLTMAAVRFAVASAVLALLRWRVEPGTRFAPRERGLLALSGLFGVTIYFFFETRGIRLTNASSAALIIATIPVFTVAAEVMLFRRRITWQQGMGIALSVLGVYLIVGRSGVRFERAVEGNLMMLGACLAWVAYVSLSRGLAAVPGRGLALTAWQNLAGAVLLAPLAFTERAAWFVPPPAAWGNILYLALFCSALGYFLYQFALARLGPVAVAAYLNLVPVVGAAGGLVLLGEALSAEQAVGGLIVIAGVFLVSLFAPMVRAAGAREPR